MYQKEKNYKFQQQIIILYQYDWILKYFYFHMYTKKIVIFRNDEK